ncbi:glycosyltransferase family 4 protein [uncultured Dechloromonas sp.]|uniref:glycosyltransferase family 4 protein n=1 Tax=uncultured Dechloromonas sp. TaxID=171719 RepID=UPI0025E4FCAD|nr:glycosyltransferase family 4 protein [uncultured Dechloromonas sp.]
MKLAVFKDYGVGRYFAQLFDSIPDTTFFLSEKNKSGLNITPHRVHLLTKKQQLRDYLKSPLKAWRRLQENDKDKKRDFFYQEVERSAASGEFDVALTGSDRSLHTLASLKAKGHRFKLVYWIPFTIPFVDMFDPRSLAIRQAAFPQVDLFVAITDTCRRVLLLEGIPEEKIVHVYPGVDTEVFQPRAQPAKDDVFRVLFVGKLVSWKGCYTLLYAAKELLAEIPSLELTFVGQGAQRQGLEQAAELLGIKDRVKFTGFLKYDALPDIYAQSDAFVLPALPAINLAEQFGFVVAEAMACGLPTLVSRVGGLPEVVGERDELIFTPGDFRELAARLRAIHASRELAAELGVHCLNHARRHYDARRNGLALKAVLEKMEQGR